MTKSDDAILEVLAETGAALSLKALEVNCQIYHNRISYNTAKRRVPRLLKAGLIRRTDENQRFVVITENGRKYLLGEYLPEELEE